MIRLELKGPIAKLAIDNPPLNLITLQMRRELGRLLGELDGRGVRALVVTSAGGVLSAGGDVTEFLNSSPSDLLEWGKTIEMLADLPFPTIAVVKGYAFGAGFEMALSCDIRIASRNAVMACPRCGSA